MRFARYALRRILILVPQAFGILTVTFVLIRALPGDPSRLAAGGLATEDQIALVRRQLGLDHSLLTQYWIYLKNLVHGDLGSSWYTSNQITADLLSRFPATLELVTYSLVLALVIGVPAGMLLAIRPGGWPDRAVFGYGLFAGALPEFWWGLMLIFAFFFKLHWFPAPLGRFGIGDDPPHHLTGIYSLDALLTGNWSAFAAAVTYLALPVFTLAFVICGPFMKMTRQTMAAVLESDYMRFSRGLGIRRSVMARRALRNALPPVVTLVGIVYGYLIGGAVLVETVFSWGGIGQYAVQAITNADYAAIQGVVLFASTFALVIYLLVDLFHMAIDPRAAH